MALLVDTCVLLSGLNRSDAHFQTTRLAYRRVLEASIPLFVSLQNIAEMWNVSTRPIDKNGHGLSPEFAMKRVHVIERLFSLTTENEVSYQVLCRLLTDHDVKGTAVHDARLVSVMIRDGLETIATYNIDDFRRFESEGIHIMTPTDLADGMLP